MSANFTFIPHSREDFAVPGKAVAASRACPVVGAHVGVGQVVRQVAHGPAPPVVVPRVPVLGALRSLVLEVGIWVPAGAHVEVCVA